MKIYTLWRHNGDETAMPWIVDSIDEYTMEEHNGYPEDYAKMRNSEGVKELVLEVSDRSIIKLFHSPVVTASVLED